MPRKLENADGIYPYELWPLKEVMDELQAIDKDPDHPLPAALEGLRHGDPWDPDYLLPTILETARTLSTNENADTREDANKIIESIGWLRTRRIPEQLRGDAELATGYAEKYLVNDVVKAALAVGMLYERCYARKHEKAVIQVNSTTRELRKGAQENQHDPADIDNAIRMYEQRLKTKPKSKKAAAQLWVRGNTGIPQSTLRYHLAKRKKKQPKNF